MARGLLSFGLIVIASALFVLSLVFLIEVVLATLPARDNNADDAGRQGEVSTERYAVLVPAHDEESVIAETAAAILADLPANGRAGAPRCEWFADGGEGDHDGWVTAHLADSVGGKAARNAHVRSAHANVTMAAHRIGVTPPRSLMRARCLTSSREVTYPKIFEAPQRVTLIGRPRAGVGLALLMKVLDTRLRCRQKIQAATGHPILARVTVPTG